MREKERKRLQLGMIHRQVRLIEMMTPVCKFFEKKSQEIIELSERITQTDKSSCYQKLRKYEISYSSSLIRLQFTE